MNRINIAVVGCGSITTTRHIPEIINNPNCNLIGVFNKTEKRALDIAEKYGCISYQSLEALFNDKKVDAIYVCTSNSSHADISIKALNSGKHVLCEKPMAMSMEECELMLEAAKRNNKQLIIGHDMKLTSVHQAAKKIIKAGELGKVISVRSSIKHVGPENWSVNKGNDTWFFNKEKAGFGALGDIGIHKIDLVRFLLDDEIVRVCSLNGSLSKKDLQGNPISIEDNALCLFSTKLGVQGIIEASWCDYGTPDISTDILCEKGRIKILMDNRYNIIIEHLEGKIEKLAIPNSQYSGVTQDFIDTILGYKQSPNDGLNACRSLGVVIAAEESAKQGIWIDIKNL